jgi:hypothetical protein
MGLVDSGSRRRKLTEIIHLFDACQNTVTVRSRQLLLRQASELKALILKGNAVWSYFQQTDMKAVKHR